MTRTVILAASVLGTLLIGAVVDVTGQDRPSPPLRASEGTAVGPDLLGKRYTDPLGGFSLCPPRGGRQVKTKHALYLAQWLRRDAGTDETIWSLNAYRTTMKHAQTDIKSCAKVLAREIEKQPGAKVESTRFMTVAGTSAVSFAGKMTGRSQIGSTGLQTDLSDMFFRQVWIPTGPGKFLVVEWGVLASQKPLIQPTWKAILASVKLFDPKVAILKQKENAKRSQRLLWEEITPEKLRAAMTTDPKWFLVYKDKKTVGWLCVQARPSRMNQDVGYEIRTWAMYEIPKQKIRLVRQRMFTNPKFSLERWHIHVQVGAGPDTVMVAEDGIRQRGLILCTLSDPQQRRMQKKLPESVKDIYLPKALGMVLPVLVDRSRKAVYTFAEYAGAENDFHMRTFTVAGPELIQHNGKWVEAVKITDQPSTGAEPIVLWVDVKGNVLRSRSPDGLISESVTPEAVRRTYPRAKSIIARMNFAEKNIRKRPKSK